MAIPLVGRVERVKVLRPISHNTNEHWASIKNSGRFCKLPHENKLILGNHGLFNYQQNGEKM